MGELENMKLWVGIKVDPDLWCLAEENGIFLEEDTITIGHKKFQIHCPAYKEAQAHGEFMNVDQYIQQNRNGLHKYFRWNYQTQTTKQPCLLHTHSKK